jgi:hypothetical protein
MTRAIIGIAKVSAPVLLDGNMNRFVAPFSVR